MNILYITDQFPTSENKIAGCFIYKRVEYLLNNKINVEVIKINPLITRKNPFNYLKNYNLKDIAFKNSLDIIVLNQLTINRLYYNYGIMDSKIIRRIKEHFFKNKLDLIHTHFVWNGIIGYKLKKMFNIPYVVTVHGSDIHTFPYKNNFYKKNMITILENASKVIFVSNYLLDKAKSFGYSGSNSIIITNGFDKKIFKVMNYKKKNNEKIVGFIGNLIPIKRADRLPDIFLNVFKKNKDIRFIIIGDGPLRNRIINKLEKIDLINKTTLTGIMPAIKVSEYINTMDILILPSKQEGFGSVIIEAQACGIPVVGSANGGIPEAIGEGGVTVSEGANFEERFADEVIRIINNPISKEKIIRRVKNYCWDEIIKKEIDVYKSIIN